MVEWTIRFSALLYVAAVAMMLIRKGPVRITWTLAWMFHVEHIALAFHYVHKWSHEAAYRETARQTAELIGVGWGGGLYWNYLFSVLWTADVAWWWVARGSYEGRSRWIGAAIHGFLGLIFFNGVVVFGPGPVRRAGIAAAAGLAALAIHRVFSK